MKINFINILSLLVVVNLNSLRANVVIEVDNIDNPHYVSERPVPYISVDGDLYIEDTSPANSEVPGLYVEGITNLNGGLVLEGTDIIPLYANGGAYMSANSNRKIVLGEHSITSSQDMNPTLSAWGLSIITIDRSTGMIRSNKEYELWGSNLYCDMMAEDLAALEDGSVIVVITSHFVWSIGWFKLHEALLTQLQRMGASNTIENHYYDDTKNVYSLLKNYTLIGIPGIGTGNGIEVINEDSPENQTTPATMKTAEVNTLLIKAGVDGKFLPLGLGFGSSKLSTLVNPVTGTSSLSVHEDGSVQLATPGGDVSMGAYSE